MSFKYLSDEEAEALQVIQNYREARRDFGATSEEVGAARIALYDFEEELRTIVRSPPPRSSKAMELWLEERRDYWLNEAQRLALVVRSLGGSPELNASPSDSVHPSCSLEICRSCGMCQQPTFCEGIKRERRATSIGQHPEDDTQLWEETLRMLQHVAVRVNGQAARLFADEAECILRRINGCMNYAPNGNAEGLGKHCPICGRADKPACQPGPEADECGRRMMFDQFGEKTIPVSHREAVARIIHPEAFRLGNENYFGPDMTEAWYSGAQRIAYRKADGILTALRPAPAPTNLMPSHVLEQQIISKPGCAGNGS